jgi:elongation factor P--(R)-beta-lysine ligase
VLRVEAGEYLPSGEFARFARNARVLQQRQLATQAVRNYFSAAGFLEVETPTRVLAPGTDVYLDPLPSGSHWLITSPEFHLKRLLVGGIPRVFEFARCFRADEVGPWHQPQFSLLEWYRAFADYASVMNDTEAVFTCITRSLALPDHVSVGKYRVALSPPFERLSAKTVFQRYANVPDVALLAQEHETRYFEHWVNDIEPALAALGRPVFVTEFPLTHAPNYAERFELFAGGIELCNGYGELTCADTQAQRFKEDVSRRTQLQKPELPIDAAFLRALREGMPRASGNALGFERLLALLLERPLDDVVAFPSRRPD